MLLTVIIHILLPNKLFNHSLDPTGVRFPLKASDEKINKRRFHRFFAVFIFWANLMIQEAKADFFIIHVFEQHLTICINFGFLFEFWCFMSVLVLLPNPLLAEVNIRRFRFKSWKDLMLFMLGRFKYILESNIFIRFATEFDAKVAKSSFFATSNFKPQRNWEWTHSTLSKLK